KIYDMSLVIVGSVAFDALETPFGKTDKIVGGAATFAGLAASYLFDKVKLISVVGEDFGAANMRVLTARGIDVDGVEVVPGGTACCWRGRSRTDMVRRETLVPELSVLAVFGRKGPASCRACEYPWSG